MKLAWIVAFLVVVNSNGASAQTVCPNAVSTNEYSSCVSEVLSPDTGKIDGLSITIKNKSVFPLKCEVVVDSYQAKMNVLGIDDCINDQPGTSRIRQRDQFTLSLEKSARYADQVVTGQAALDSNYNYCNATVNTNVACSRGCEDGKVEMNGACVVGDCYEPTYGIVLKEGQTLDKVINSSLADRRCSITTLRFSCQNRLATYTQVNSDIGVFVGNQCQTGCFDRSEKYHPLNENFPEAYNSFSPDQTCSYVEQTSTCRSGYSASIGDQNVAPGFTHGAECRTACEVDGRRLKLGEVIEGTWSAPRPPICESVKFDKVCSDRYVLTTKRNSRIVGPGGVVSRPGTPRPSRCGGSEL